MSLLWRIITKNVASELISRHTPPIRTKALLLIFLFSGLSMRPILLPIFIHSGDKEHVTSNDEINNIHNL